MWFGALTDVPGGWHICNGKEQTPDLVNKFAMGAGSNGMLGSTGGESKVTLTTEQIPKHSHNLSNTVYKWHRSFEGDDSEPRALTNYKAGSDQDPYLSKTETIGEGLSHENLPPYVGLFFIMKVR
jgi:microcystin-dependent protein